uniref:SAM domain-containing protein n=1 Tax=Noccaea caerulescens TaxID=107243 RepID=A0A1J3GAQ3_NOCCA
MAKQRSRQFEPSKTGPSKLGFDGEEDSWVFVKKQRVIIVLPSLPLPEHFTPEKPETSQSQAELRDGIADMQAEATPVHHTVVPPLLIPEQFILQKPETSLSQAELGNTIADMHETTLVHTVVPSLPVTEHGILEKPAASRSQSVLRDLVPDAHEATHVYPVEPESCPDFTAVDKPEMVRTRNLTTRKAPAPAPRRSHQDFRMHPNRRVENQRSRTGRKPIRFPRVMCSSVVMDNEKLRVVNLEKKVEKAGGLNEWVGSIGLGREFERMLRGQRMNKFQVANLTMEKLKHMGALAVGPRRKLIHAIHCVYHPHCLRASFN